MSVFVLNDREYKYISRAVYNYAKINLTEQKRPLIVSRLSKRIRELKMGSFAQYVEYLKDDTSGREFELLVDSLSTNFSHFFRESHHFDFLKDEVLEKAGREQLTIWSAAASTGQEVYSIVMTIKEFEEQRGRRINARLFASDISRKVLLAASKGIYQERDVEKVPRPILEKYFLRGTGEKSNLVKVKKELIGKVNFFRLNLNDKTYMLPEMDIIFLRNAIIYFDHDTKVELINRLHNYIKPNGYLILGHSESLSGISDRFELIGKTIYRRIGDD
nr:CheR family methyltransferase [Spirochaeta isovalerica]